MSIVPDVPESVPRRGSRASRWCFKLLLRIMGWAFEGAFPNLSRFVLIGGPHTSNWDFVVAMVIMGALGVRVTWIGKHTIFVWPFASLLRHLGGLPVDRSAAQGLVEQVSRQFESTERLIVGIAPEGTRRLTEHWKTGFYHIAVAAGVPIVPAYLDFQRKRVGTGSPVMPTQDMESDLRQLKAFYAPFAASARRPEWYGIQ